MCFFENTFEQMTITEKVNFLLQFIEIWSEINGLGYKYKV